MSDIPDGFEKLSLSSNFLGRAGPYFGRKQNDLMVIGLRIDEGHTNQAGVAHGGVLTTLADVALSYQLYYGQTPPLPVATISLTTEFLGAGKLDDWLEAHTIIDRIGKNTAFAHGQIVRGDRIIAKMTGVYRVG